MATIDPVINGETGLAARTKINTALATVDVVGTLVGDGTFTNPIGIDTTTGIFYISKADPQIGVDTENDLRIRKSLPTDDVGEGLFIFERFLNGVWGRRFAI